MKVTSSSEKIANGVPNERREVHFLSPAFLLNFGNA